jgi:hypothetical protein
VTVTAHVRVSHPDRGDELHPATVIEASTTPGEPSIIDVPDFGLYAVGVHPELGPLGVYVTPTPGVDPEPAPARLTDMGGLEVALLADRIVLVVTGHPLPDAVEQSPPSTERRQMTEQTPENSGTGDVNVEGDAVINTAPDGGGVDDQGGQASEQTKTDDE